jgi:hypothetical protein
MSNSSYLGYDKKSREADKFVVRLPEGKREEIADAARDNHRSMNAQILVAIENDKTVRRLEKEHRIEKMAFIWQIESMAEIMEDLLTGSPEKQEAAREKAKKLLAKIAAPMSV